MTVARLTQDAYRRRATEAQLREAIAELVAWRGGRLWSIRDSRNAPETADMPDLIVLVPGVTPGEVIAALVELKSQSRSLTMGQREVASLLSSVTRFVGGIVRPEPKEGEISYDDFLRILGV